MKLETFGPYTLIERLGIGGMAEVFLATVLRENRTERVAVKRLLFQHAKDASFVSMFSDEARISAQLIHQNIARVYDYGEVEGRPYIAMEYIDGKDLPAVLSSFETQKSVMPLRMAVYVGRSIADALAHAHDLRDRDGRLLNVVHRDISPQNVLIGFDGVVKLIDFGIAKARDRLEETVGGVVKGKFAYMSPEQVQGGEIDGRSDVFSLGIVIHEMISGRPLFLTENTLTTASNVLQMPVPPLREIDPNIPSELDKIVQQALRRKPLDRFNSASELSSALQGVMRGDARLSMTPDLVARWMRRTFDLEGQGAEIPTAPPRSKAPSPSRPFTPLPSPRAAGPAPMTPSSRARRPAPARPMAPALPPVPPRAPEGDAARVGDKTTPDLSAFYDLDGYDDDGETTRADIPAWYGQAMSDEGEPPPAKDTSNTGFEDDLPTMMNLRWDGEGRRPVPDDFGAPHPPGGQAPAAPHGASALPGFGDQSEEPTRADPSWRSGTPSTPSLDPRAATSTPRGDDAWLEAPTSQHFDPKAISFAAGGAEPAAPSSTGQQPIDLGTQQRLDVAARALDALQNEGASGPSATVMAPTDAPSNLRYWLVFGGIVFLGSLAAVLIVILR